MKKLIELLNECKGKSYRFGTNGDNSIYQKETDAYGNIHITVLPDYKLISKQFGFVKWLVENDKIDTDAYKTVYSGDLDKRKTLTMSSGGDEFYQVTEHGVYESLLMLLSISDTPIEDLLLYLR